MDNEAGYAAEYDAVTDAEIEAGLAERGGSPYPGTWHSAPFADRAVFDVDYAVVAFDLGLSALGVRRDDGSLWLLPADGDPHLVNSSVAAFTACTHAYDQARTEAEADGDSGDRDALTDALLERLASIDGAAAAEENSFWHAAAEELGRGMAA